MKFLIFERSAFEFIFHGVPICSSENSMGYAVSELIREIWIFNNFRVKEIPCLSITVFAALRYILHIDKRFSDFCGLWGSIKFPEGRIFNITDTKILHPRIIHIY